MTVKQRAVDIWEFRAGKLARGMIGYTDRDAALKAAAEHGDAEASRIAARLA